MNNTEIFERVSKHLLTQGAKAKVGPNCKYRAEDGYVCAVRCLIPDDEYTSSLEGGTILTNRRVQEILTRRLGIDMAVSLDLLFALQQVHDGWVVDIWAIGLNNVKVRFGL